MTSPCPSPAADLPGFLAWHRAQFGTARMEGDGGAGGQGGAGDGGQGGTGGGSQGGGTEKTFTQADMNATAARVEAAAKAKAEQDIATALGVTVDEAKTIIAERKSADDAKKTEAERAAAVAETAKHAAETDRAAAARERHEARVERILGQAGLDISNETLRVAALAAVKADIGADEAVVKAAVEQAKKDAPALFAASTGGNGGGTHSDAGGQRKDQQAPAGEFGARGAEEAKRRWGTQETKTA